MRRINIVSEGRQHNLSSKASCFSCKLPICAFILDTFLDKKNTRQEIWSNNHLVQSKLCCTINITVSEGRQHNSRQKQTASVACLSFICAFIHPWQSKQQTPHSATAPTTITTLDVQAQTSCNPKACCNVAHGQPG